MPDEKTLWHEVLQRLARIEENTKMLDGIADKAREAFAKSKANEAEIEEMKDAQKWLWRSVVGLFVAYLVKIIFGI